MAGTTEFFVKMNRLVLPDADAHTPQVRFRSVVVEPIYDESRHARVDDVSDDESVSPQHKVNVEEDETPHFFKDPIRGPLSEFETEEAEIEASFKLGRNMRASNGRSRSKDIHELMNKKRQLLQQQMEQKDLVVKEETSEQQASILVNNLLMQGFHISAPTNLETCSAYSSTLHLPQKGEEEEVESEKVKGERQKLVKAIHKQLVRVQGVTGE